MKNKTMNKN